jgi:hypothetical protein
MANAVGNIVSNSIEDSSQDFLQSYVNNRVQSLTKPLLDKYNSGSPFDDAMQTLISGLVMGGTMLFYQKASYIIERSLSLVGISWLYITSGGLKKKLADKLKASKFKGNKAFKVLGLVSGTDRTAERIEVVKLANQNISSFDAYKFHNENLHQRASHNLDNFSQSAVNIKANDMTSSLALFNQKTRMGKWELTNVDKKLYIKVTGATLAEQGETSWSNMYKELNKFTDFYMNVDKEVVNLTQAIGKITARAGSTK